jgi:hypothetical protein
LRRRYPRKGAGMNKEKIIEVLKLAQEALHMATLPFPIDPVKTQRALEAVDKVLKHIGSSENDI